MLVVALALLAVGCANPGGGGPTATTTPPAGSTATITVGGELIEVSGPTGSTVSVVAGDLGSLPSPPAGLVFPFGALHLEVHGVTPGAVVRVSVALQTPVDTFRKTIAGAWDPFTLNGTTGGTLSAAGTTIDLDIADGGRGDDDGLANGVIIDDVAPATATTLTITSNDLPLARYGQAYSHQLAAAGAAGPVTWSVLSGLMPTGITLDSSGLLSGTPTGNSGMPVRVQATDGATTATKLLLVAAMSADDGGATSNGTPLSEGSRIFFATFVAGCNTCGAWPATYLSDGTLSPISTISINSVRTLQGALVFVNPEGTRVVTANWPSTPGFATGPIDVVDGDTGAIVTTLEPSPTFQLSSMAFSPDGSYFALTDQSGTSQVFETATWSVVRTATGMSGQFLWSADSTEIAAGIGANVEVRSVASPAGDRTVTVPGQSSCNLSDWSSTNRFAFFCGPSVVTLSAVDGSDVRFVTPPCLIGEVCTYHYFPKFSPSGSQLTFGELAFTSFDPVSAFASVVVAADAADAPRTPLVTTSSSIDQRIAMVIGWR